MKIDPVSYQVHRGEPVDLTVWPTQVEPIYESKREYKKLLGEHVDRLRDLQRTLYAADTFALLVVFQGMDAAGKDGAIRHVMSGVNPQGCEVHSFKQPSHAELQRDFLWRSQRQLPERGRIGIFNRSYYEDVLIVRVHPELLADRGLDPRLGGRASFWRARYRSIIDFERHLHRNRTRVVKIFLHLSKEEQRKRFLARIDEPEKHWKFNAGDVTERAFWDRYHEAYEDCLAATSTLEAPWFIVPADDKANARLIVSQIILQALEDMDPQYPQTSAERLEELKSLRKTLAKPE